MERGCREGVVRLWRSDSTCSGEEKGSSASAVASRGALKDSPLMAPEHGCSAGVTCRDSAARKRTWDAERYRPCLQILEAYPPPSKEDFTAWYPGLARCVRLLREMKLRSSHS